MSFNLSRIINNLSFETQNITNENGNTNISGNTSLDSVIVSGPTIVKTLDNNQYNLQTSTNGNTGDVLKSNGSGSTFWGVPTVIGSGI
jgi:hypothetical protein